jgi:type IV pilus assembly protein PilA
MRAAPTLRRYGFTLVELMIVVMIVGILAMLAIYGVRKYVSNAKSAEARNSLGQMSKDATTAFERESMAAIVLSKGTATAATRALCASATQTVPAAIASVKGKKYQANQAPSVDWNVDEAKNKGFACLKFAIQAPQYYEYNYTSDGDVTVPTMGTKFTAVANGDLNGDGVLSTFQVLGAVANKQLYIGPTIMETDPEE